MPTKRPVFLYSLLAVLFAVNLLYRVFYLPGFIHLEGLNFPFFFVESGSDGIDLATPRAVDFGIHNGDHLVDVNGTPYTGTGVLGRAFTKAEAGTPLQVTIVLLHGPGGGQRTISLPVTKSNFESWDVVSDSVVGSVLPLMSLVLGFWVAFRRPRDPMAWLLLALMMSFPHILQTFLYRMGGRPDGGKRACSTRAPSRRLSPSSFTCLAASFPSLSPREVHTTRCGGPCCGFARFLSPS